MQRNEWKFDYTASRLAEAASDKIAYQTPLRHRPTNSPPAVDNNC